MMKKLILGHFVVLFLLVTFVSCNSSKKTAEVVEKKDENVVLRFEAQNCTEGTQLFLLQFDGYSFNPYQKAKADSNNVFTFSVPSSDHQFYFLGPNPRQTKPIILGTEKNLTLQGNCTNLRKSAFVNSPINEDYEKAISDIRGFQAQAKNLNRQLVRATPGTDTHNEIMEKLKGNDSKQLELLNSMRLKHPFVGKLVATKTYLSYRHNKGNYENEVQYYLNEVFAHLDMTDPALDRMPALFETFRDYTNTLIAIKYDRNKMKETLNGTLKKMNADSYAYRYALGAVMQSLKAKNHPAYLDYADIFLEKYGSENKPYFEEIKLNMKNATSFLDGAVAPDFSQNDPEGNPIKLSDLRGKVVLVDFWASWCGPCRRENPNVVRLYNKYKDAGFEVLGVSLDKTKDKWLKAIEKDKLTWLHVSDLKGWSNAVAKQYSVSSIPHTILLDRDGKIITRNLRGEGLAMKLKEIFGK